MKVFSDVDQVRAFSRECRRRGQRIGFVPTMGSLHAGHLSLVALARERCDVVIASNYVNPTQFAAHEDFDVYPVDKDRDREKLREAGCDAVFEPTSLYTHRGDRRCQEWLSDFAGDSRYRRHWDGGREAEKHPGQSSDLRHRLLSFMTRSVVRQLCQVERLGKPLCGVSRPHFFRGVATVVTKLFNIVEPDVAVFGLKDYQQFRVIKTLTKELNFDIEIVGGPICREPDGLAMSSRNTLLHEEIRPKCTVLYQSLKWAEEMLLKPVSEATTPVYVIEEIQRRITDEGGAVDYVEIADAETLEEIETFSSGMSILIAVAAFFWNRAREPQVRLIDNICIALPSI